LESRGPGAERAGLLDREDIMIGAIRDRRIFLVERFNTGTDSADYLFGARPITETAAPSQSDCSLNKYRQIVGNIRHVSARRNEQSPRTFSGRHPRYGTIYFWCSAGVFLTSTSSAAVHWA
jgi:hypothetical protein